MNITSTAFSNNEAIPALYTCQGDDISPPLEISEVPRGTHSLVLIMDDPDAPGGTWVHWVVWNITPDVLVFDEAHVPPGAVQGMNSWGRSGYGGPCPPSGEHRYVFTVYAVTDYLSLNASSDKDTVLRAIESKTIESAELIGLYKKS